MMPTKPWLTLSLVVGLLGACSAGARQPAARPGVVETPIATADGPIQDPRFSEDGRHVAWLAPAPGEPGGRQCLVLDGTPGPACDEAALDSLAMRGGRAAYRARRGDQWFVVVDGKAGPACEAILDGSPRLSPDGQHVAYAIRSGGKQRVVLDGAPGKEYDAILYNYLVFSPEGGHLAYAARTCKKQVMVVDGRESPEYQVAGLAIFSPDGRHVACEVYQDGKDRMIVDGKEDASLMTLLDKMQVFVPGGTRLRYGTHDGRPILLLDGQPAGEHAATYRGWGMPVLSADGKRAAFQAMTIDGSGNPAWRMVVDGKEMRPYEHLSEQDSHSNTPPAFSPDGRHLAYAARRNHRWHVVLDEAEAPAFAGVETLVFSPDSRHLAYRAQEGSAWRVVRDGQKGPRFSAIGTPVFSPESQHLAYPAQHGGKWTMILDGLADTPSGFDTLGPPTFDATGRLQYLAIRGHQLLRITDAPH